MIHKARMSKLFVRMFACLFFVFGGVCAANASVYIETLAMPANSAFTFTLSAQGAFRVDCGADGTLGGVGVSGDLIDRTSISTNDTYSCKYSSAGKRKIKIDGTATGYSTETGFVPVISFASSCANIRLVDGDLSVMFPILANISIPRYISTFEGCSNITSIPDTLFSSYTLTGQYMFWNTFKNCTGLGTSTDPNEVALPAGLFSGITGFITGIPQAGFYYTFEGCANLKEIPENLFLGIRNNTQGANHTFAGTFSGCSSLTTIPANLFAFASNISGKQSMFYETFKGCSSLTTIPDGLFRTFSTAGIRMFQRTFANCTSLSSIPDGLFSWVTTATEGLFSNTFSGCTGLSGYVSPKLFKALTQNGAPNAYDFMTNTFYNTGLATSCPSGTGQYKTGYESSWGGKVSCTTFSTETTSLAANSTFAFTLSAQGTFDVYCGVGGTLSGTGVSGNTITRSGTTNDTYTCTYSNAGTKTVGINGTATGYYSDSSTYASAISFESNESIRTVAGSLSSVFPFYGTTDQNAPKFRQTFKDCRGLVSLDNALFSGYTTASRGMFVETFSDCTSLIAIPENLFSSISAVDTGVFEKTFFGCTSLTAIPENLFSHISIGTAALFSHTFENCAGLLEIPEDLFATIQTAGAGMFQGAFAGCTSLTSIPEDLFANLTNTASGLFSRTFQNCTGLLEIPEDLFAHNTTAVDSMFYGTFQGCTRLTSIPEGLFSHISSGAHSMFTATFSGCTGLLEIPEDLFSTITNIPSGAEFMFAETFMSCTGLTSIPEDLFANITAGTNYMFGSTFRSCTGLTELPENLFANITTGATGLFSTTFMGCNHLTGYIPASFFTGLVANGSIYSSGMMTNMFNNTTLATSCNNYVGKQQYITHYEDYWNSKVSCKNAEYTITYSCGASNGTAPTTNTSATYSESFTPAANTCGTPGGYSGFSGWLVSGTNTVKTAGTAFTWDYTENKTFTAQYSANTISVTWDNETTSSCNYGGLLDVEQPDPRTGYVFMGWKKRSCLYNQDTSINSTAQSYYSITNTCCINTACGSGYCSNTNFNDLSTGDWKVFFDYGTIYGTSMCSETSGTLRAVGNPSSTSGSYCWCAVTRFVSSDQTQQCNAANLIWVLKGNVNNCGNNCAYGCASFTKLQSDFRAALYGQTQ